LEKYFNYNVIIKIMQKGIKWIPYLVVFTGLYEIFSGIILIDIREKFIANLVKESLLMGTTGAFLPLLYGIFLIIIYRGLKKRTWTSWYMAMSFIILYFITAVLRTSKLYYIDFVGVILNIVSIYLLIKYRKSFVYPPLANLPTEALVSLALVFFSIFYGIAGSLIIGDQFSPHITDIGTAFYYTVEVMTTLGFGDILPVTFLSRMFTSSLVILGIASFFGAIVSLLGPVLQKRMERVVNVMENVEFAGMKNHIIFCGYSPLIQGLIFELKKKEEPLLLIVRDQDNYTFLKNDGFLVFKERADNAEALIKAGIKKAKQVYLSSNDDGYNVLVALTVNKLKREFNPNLKISIFVTSSRNIEMVKDLVDEVIDVSEILKEYIIKD